MIELAFEPSETSRLGCQLKLSPGPERFLRCSEIEAQIGGDDSHHPWRGKQHVPGRRDGWLEFGA